MARPIIPSILAPFRVGPRRHPVAARAVVYRGHSGNGAEALAGLSLHHVLGRGAALVVAVVGQGDGQRCGEVLLGPKKDDS